MNPGQSNKLRFSLVLLVAVAVVFGAAGFVLKAAVSPYESAPGKKELFELKKGTTPPAIARTLEEKGLIRSATLFLWLGKARGSWPKMKAGEYEISSSMSSVRILDVLTSGVSVLRPFLVREGENIYEIAQRAEDRGWGKAKDFLALARDPQFIAQLKFSPPQPTSLEGYLFPDTYAFSRKETQAEILKTMVRRFQSFWGPNEEQRAREIGMTRNQVITLASIVEKETGAADERGIIAGVFHNRLRKKMRLQSDPTTIYGIWTRYKGNIRRSDLLEATPYNTYAIAALPIGPISNPGADAIRATLNPAAHHYLYFVSRNDGTHEFTATYGDHSAAVTRFQLDQRARQGKSWRDLNKKLKASPVPAVAPSPQSGISKR